MGIFTATLPHVLVVWLLPEHEEDKFTLLPQLFFTPTMTL
jgi:hypothetical protein